jgi:hypothetical protein
MQSGRVQSKAVRDYLIALESNKPKRGRPRTADSVKKRLAAIGKELQTADALDRLAITQERMDLEHELAALEARNNLDELEAGFIAHAAEYAERKAISYAAFREVGVAAAVLKAAGISR